MGDDQTLKGKKLEAYVLLKILKFCTGSSARSYQCKFAVDQTFINTGIESMEEMGTAIKEIINYDTIRGKFSSVHPDLAAEGITRVEVGEEGLHFIRSHEPEEVDQEAPNEVATPEGMVGIIVTIEEELLRRVEASVPP